MNTGYVQVKYQLLKQWPIVSADLTNTNDLINVDIHVTVNRLVDAEGREDLTENI